MPQWLKDSVFYQIYPQSFYDSNNDGIGDIKGIIEKLDYVKSIGCNAIWLNPCFESPFKDGGYDVSDYKRVAPRYGTNDDLVNLFKVAHSKNMKIILDLVPGHTSDKHEWFAQSSLPNRNELSDRYIWTDSAWVSPPPYRFECGLTDRDGNYLVNFFSSQPALNYGFYEINHPDWQLPPEHPSCRQTIEAIKDIMRFWLDKGCDGFRVDMADSLVKNDDEKIATARVWQDIRKMLNEEYPDSVLISEWSCPQRALKCGFDCDFYLDHEGNGYNTLFRHTVGKINEQKSFFSKEGNGDITLFTQDYLKKYNESKDYGYISFFTCNHDTPRMTRFFDALECKLAYCFIFTMPGVPFLYYGDEIGMKYIKNLTSKEGGFHRTGTRTPMQWSSGKNLGFSNASEKELYLPVDGADDAPNVELQENDASSLLNTVKAIIKLRHENEDLQADGSFEVLYAEKNKYPFIYKRGKFIIAVNPSAQKVSAPIDINGSEVFLIGGYQLSDTRIDIEPQTFLILSTN